MKLRGFVPTKTKQCEVERYIFVVQLSMVGTYRFVLGGIRPLRKTACTPPCAPRVSHWDASPPRRSERRPVRAHALTRAARRGNGGRIRVLRRARCTIAC